MIGLIIFETIALYFKEFNGGLQDRTDSQLLTVSATARLSSQSPIQQKILCYLDCPDMIYMENENLSYSHMLSGVK
jgi:hypothetical protein